MVLVTALSVIITANSRTDEATGLGKIIPNSKNTLIYIKDINMSFSIPSASSRYFSDTKNNNVRRYTSGINATFVAEIGDNYELEIHIDPEELKEYNLQDATFEQALYDYISDSGYKYAFGQYELQDFEKGNNVIVGDYEYITCNYTRKATSFKEYDQVSSYITTYKNMLIEIRAIKLYSSPVSPCALYEKDKTVEAIIDSLALRVKEPRATQLNSNNSILNLNYSMWIFLIPLGYILICNVRGCNSYGVWHDDFDGQEHSKELLGIMAVFIVLHHLVQQVGTDNAGIMNFLENAGVCFVGAYFFYSGYGLAHSFIVKDNYLKGFFKKRLSTVLIPAYLCNIIFVINETLNGGLDSISDYVLALSGIRLLNSHMWYIVEITILYIFFYIVFRLLKKPQKAIILMTILVLGLMTGSMLAGHGDAWFQGEWWYNTTLLFTLGMFYALHRQKFITLIRRHYKCAIIMTLVSFLVLYKANERILLHYGYWSEYSGKTYFASCLDKLISLAVQLPMVCSFILLILVIGQKVKCSNSVLRFFGRISLELYLIHNLFIARLDFVSGTGIYCTLVVVASIIAATILYRIDNVLIFLVTKRQRYAPVSVWPAIVSGVHNLKRAAKMKLVYAVKHPRKMLRILFRQLVCIILVLGVLIPLYYMILKGTHSNRELKFQLLPGKYFLPNIDSINEEFRSAGGNLFLGIRNSCIIAIPTALLSTYLAALTAYAFERYNFKGKEILWKAVIACMFIPTTVSFTGFLHTAYELRINNNLITLIFLGLANPAAVYFIRMYLKNVRLDELCEAARIDSASEIRIFNVIMLPLIRPVLALQLTFSFVSAWNKGYEQTMLLMDWDKKTISQYIALLAGGNGPIPAEEYSVMILGTLVPLLIYILCSKSIISSITLGGIKE